MVSGQELSPMTPAASDEAAVHMLPLEHFYRRPGLEVDLDREHYLVATAFNPADTPVTDLRLDLSDRVAVEP